MYIYYITYVTEHKRKLLVISYSLRVVVVHRDCIMCVPYPRTKLLTNCDLVKVGKWCKSNKIRVSWSL